MLLLLLLRVSPVQKAIGSCCALFWPPLFRWLLLLVRLLLQRPRLLLFLLLFALADDAEGAVASARLVYASIKAAQEQLLADSFLLSETADAEETEEGEGAISLETRINACRLFIDVGLVQEAIEVLKGCLEEDDEDVRGCCCCRCC